MWLRCVYINHLNIYTAFLQCTGGSIQCHTNWGWIIVVLLTSHCFSLSRTRTLLHQLPASVFLLPVSCRSCVFVIPQCVLLSSRHLAYTAILWMLYIFTPVFSVCVLFVFLELLLDYFCILMDFSAPDIFLWFIVRNKLTGTSCFSVSLLDVCLFVCLWAECSEIGPGSIVSVSVPRWL